MTAAELIEVAKGWDYSKVSDEEMFAWMKQAENIGFMEMLVQAPVMLVRGRCELDYECKLPPQVSQSKVEVRQLDETRWELRS